MYSLNPSFNIETISSNIEIKNPLRSLINNKSVQINIDFEDFSDVVSSSLICGFISSISSFISSISYLFSFNISWFVIAAFDNSFK